MSAKTKTTFAEFDLINKIAGRAVDMNPNLDHMDVVMDVALCHCNGTELNLSALAGAPDMDFMNDVYGISANINRETGKLENCILKFAVA